MPIPKNKKELLSAIDLTYSKLQKDLETIPLEASIRVELEGHAKVTQMSICNLVAYLIGWGELVLKWQEKKSRGEEVVFPETGYKWNELGRLAQKFYVDYEDLDYLALLTKLDKVVNRIVLLIEGLDNAELYEKPWYDKWTMGRMIQLNTSSPYKNARTRVRKWKRGKE
ncbi:MAG: ClbS/DfsB family four-helix bundle protein [Chitinophagales bacterium]